MRAFEKALKENTKALKQNTEVLRVLSSDKDKKTNLEKRRMEIKAGGPYSEEDLLAFKRPDLVMLAAQLGVTNTSIPQRKLVDAVLAAQ
jgi:hypothetical protein